MTDKTDIAALPKMTLEDLLSRCTDYDDMSLSMDASELKMLKQHISLLEAERQRVAEITEQYVDRTAALSFATQRAEAAEKEVTYWCNLNARKNEEISELRAKLANPVVLPTVQHFDGDEWCWKNAVINNIRAAGFTVKGE